MPLDVIQGSRVGHKSHDGTLFKSEKAARSALDKDRRALLADGRPERGSESFAVMVQGAGELRDELAWNRSIPIRRSSRRVRSVPLDPQSLGIVGARLDALCSNSVTQEVLQTARPCTFADAERDERPEFGSIPFQ